MPTFRTVHSDEKVKVAVVFELDKIRPVWFEILGKERVQVGEICGIWHHAQGAAKIINFDIWVAGRGTSSCTTPGIYPGGLT